MSLQLDLLTRIKNIHWAEARTQALLGVYPGTGSNSPALSTPFAIALDADRRFDGQLRGASGEGHTVLTRGWIAYGKPAVGAACFIAVPYNTRTIRRGIVDGKSIKWGTVGVVPGSSEPGDPCTTAVSFCNGAFFISYVNYVDGRLQEALFMRSVNGTSWTSGIAAFAGVPPCDTGPLAREGIFGRFGGSVAYHPGKRVYCTAGQILVNAAPIYDPIWMFMWATSTNGISWSGEYDDDVMEGISAEETGDFTNWPPGSLKQTSIAYGTGLFVAATGQRKAFPASVAGTFDSATSCAVATSEDGRHWTNRPLPGATIPANEVPQNGNSVNVIATGLPSSDPSKDRSTFTLIGRQHDPTGGSRSLLWRSSNGTVWTLDRQEGSGADFNGPFYSALTAVAPTLGTVSSI